jgi:hypothetical protein
LSTAFRSCSVDVYGHILNFLAQAIRKIVFPVLRKRYGAPITYRDL